LNVPVNKVIKFRVPQKSHNYMSSSEISDTDKAHADRAVREALWVWGPQKYRILNFAWGSFGLESVMLPEGSIMNP
jgi:hypothetical protein